MGEGGGLSSSNYPGVKKKMGKMWENGYVRRMRDFFGGESANASEAYAAGGDPLSDAGFTAAARCIGAPLKK